MAKSRLYKFREEVKQLVANSSLSKKEKDGWLKRIPRMLPSELMELRLNLLEQLVVDAQFETIGEIREGKHSKVDNEGLLQVVLRKVLEKADQVEGYTKRAVK